MDKRLIVVTPTAKLAYYLQRTRAFKSKNVYIISLHEWLATLWKMYVEQGDNPAFLLSPWQSYLLWQKQVQQENLPLISPQAIVEQAQYAWQLLQQWNVSLPEFYSSIQETEQGNSDSTIFCTWAKKYAEECVQNHWIDEFQLPSFLCKHLRSQETIQNGQWLFYGFDYVTPQLSALRAHMMHLGAEISVQIHQPAHSTQGRYLSYPDIESECRAAALWAQALLNNGQSKTIGIVIPGLQKRWLQVQRLFNEVFQSEPGFSVQSAAFSMDAGLMLTDYPIIADTLQLMRWLVQPLEYAQASHLIRSVFWPHSAAEWTERGQITAVLAERGYQNVRIQDVIYYLKTQTTPTCLQFLDTLTMLHEHRHTWPLTAKPSEWLEYLKNVFLLINWPNGRLFNTAETHTWNRWLELLEEVKMLDVILHKPIRFSHMIQLLQQRASKICFHPETLLAPIQIMDVNETSGIIFDHLWVCGLHAKTWPPSPSPHPFIPNSLQKTLGMPHADYQQEKNFAERLTQQWVQSAGELIFSFPQEEKHTQNMPSAVLVSRVGPPVAEKACRAIWQQVTAQPYPLSSSKYGHTCTEIVGTSRLLQRQAECPFQAYAYHRLGISQQKLTPVTELGNALMRGKVVHRALELFWKRIKNHAQLVTLSPSELLEKVQKYVTQAVAENYSALQKINAIPEIFIEVEQQRLVSLLVKWLSQEKQRAPFQVHELEHEIKWEMENISLKMRVDRIDQLENGDYIIIDYKTSKPTALSPEQGRLTHTQLALYAVSQENPLVAVVYAQLAKEIPGFLGWASADAIKDFPNTSTRSLRTTDFSVQLKEWQEKLAVLAQEFKQGYLAANPYPNTSVCKKCDLHLLCRIEESTMEDENNA